MKVKFIFCRTLAVKGLQPGTVCIEGLSRISINERIAKINEVQRGWLNYTKYNSYVVLIIERIFKEFIRYVPIANILAAH